LRFVARGYAPVMTRLPRGARAVERIDDAAEADERVLDHLAMLGCDPASPRKSTHYLYFAVPARAEDVARLLDADGWTTAIRQSEGAWLLVASRVVPLTSCTVRKTRQRLEALTAEHGGLYDGWDARI
jgi:regulator of ribonuclease activity B